MNDVPLDNGAAGGREPALETRVAVLEEIARWTRASLERIERRFDKIDDRFDQMERANEARFQKIDDRFDQMERANEARFQKIDDRFDQMERANEARFEKMERTNEARFEKMERTNEARFQKVDDQFKKVESSIHRVEVDVAELRGRLVNMPSTWAMLTAIMGGQVAFGGVVVALLRMFRLH